MLKNNKEKGTETKRLLREKKHQIKMLKNHSGIKKEELLLAIILSSTLGVLFLCRKFGKPFRMAGACPFVICLHHEKSQLHVIIISLQNMQQFEQALCMVSIYVWS